MITFRCDDKFTQHDIVRTEYSKAVDGASPAPVPLLQTSEARTGRGNWFQDRTRTGPGPGRHSDQ